MKEDVVEPSVDDSIKAQKHAAARKTFLRWMIALFLLLSFLVSVPFTIGVGIASLVVWVDAVAQSTAVAFARHPCLTAIGAALSAFFLVATAIYQAGPEFISLRRFWLTFGTLFIVWLLFFANLPVYAELTGVFLKAGGTPPGLAEAAAGLLMLIACLPMVAVVVAFVILMFCVIE